jgi:prophage regulatory protein
MFQNLSKKRGKKMNERILRRPEVVKRTGLSIVTLWRMEKAGLFPKRRALGAKAVGWLESEVELWMESRLAVNG